MAPDSFVICLYLRLKSKFCGRENGPWRELPNRAKKKNIRHHSHLNDPAVCSGFSMREKGRVIEEGAVITMKSRELVACNVGTIGKREVT